MKARGPRPDLRRVARPAGSTAPRSRGGKQPSLSVVRTPEHAPRGAPRAVGLAVLTVSDTRRGADDRSGALAHDLIERAGFEVVRRAWVRDEIAPIRATARRLLKLRGVDAVIVTGGTGMAPRDVTPEALAPLVRRELPGFGERFRALSVAQVGGAAWFSRAGAGVAGGRLLVWLPGSMPAVELALKELVLPELVHALRLLGRFQPGA